MEHPIIKETVNAIETSKPRKLDTTPRWDVNVVLKHLASDDYEPLERVPLRQVLKKALFLLALATAKRSGELHALSSTVLTSDSGMKLSFLPEFVAKTGTRANKVPRSFNLKSLTAVVGPGEEESLYCPVRALAAYQKALRDRGLGFHRNLFRSLRYPDKPLSAIFHSF